MELLASYLVAEFGHLYPNWDLADAVLELSQDPGEGLPLHLGAVENRRVVGIVSIISDDEVTGWEEDWWLANVLVLPEYRGRGIGNRLVDQAVEIARAHGAVSLHLVTNTVENWYLTQGWKTLGPGDVHGHEMVVMHLELSPSNTG